MSMYHFNAVLYIVGFIVILGAILWIAWSEHRQSEREQKKEAELDRMERARRHRAIQEAIRQQKLDRLNSYLFEQAEERDAK